MTPIQFTPIKIKQPTASDKKRIQKSTTGKNSYTIIFPFSSRPPHGWDKMFRDILDSQVEKSAQSPRLLAFVHEQELRIICSLEEIESNFSYIKAAVEATNKKYLQFLQQKSDDEETRLRKDQELKSPEERAIDKALDMLDYS